MAKMETVFDHGITEEEHENLFGVAIPKADAPRVSMAKDAENGSLYRLYSLREDHDTAKGFLNKIKSESYKFDLINIDT